MPQMTSTVRQSAHSARAASQLAAFKTTDLRDAAFA
jgi:hypothetical protein